MRGKVCATLQVKRGFQHLELPLRAVAEERSSAPEIKVESPIQSEHSSVGLRGLPFRSETAAWHSPCKVGKPRGIKGRKRPARALTTLRTAPNKRLNSLGRFADFQTLYNFMLVLAGDDDAGF